MALIIAGWGTLLGIDPASAAAGNSSLAKYVVKSPGKGWLDAPPSTVSASVSKLQTIESVAAKTTGFTSVAVAGMQWLSPSQRKFQVYLIAAIGKPLNATLATDLKKAAKVAAESACEGATTDLPTSLTSIASPPGYLSLCQPVNRSHLAAVVFVKKNVFGLILATTVKSQLLRVSQNEYKAIPSQGFTSLSATAVRT